MKNETVQKFYEDFPKIFKEQIGISCPEGWKLLLTMLCERLQFETDNNNTPQVVADQVKEKFGILRFYYHLQFEGTTGDVKSADHSAGMIEGIIRAFEDFSSKVCAKCGSNHDIEQTKGWISYQCKHCRRMNNA